MARKRSELKARIDADTTSFSTKMGKLPGMAKGAVAAIGAAFAAAVAVGGGLFKFGQFLGETEQGLAEVNTIAGVSKTRLRQLEEGVFDLGAEFGNLTKDSIGGLYDALSAGVPERNVIDFLRDASKLAIAGVSDVGTAVDVLTSILNAYRLPATEAARVSDLLFTTVRNGKTTLSELAPVVSKMAPLAASLGIDFESVSAAMASITLQGTPTAEAATQVRAAMVALSKPTTDLANLLDQIKAKYGENVLEGKSLQEQLQLIRAEAAANGIEWKTLFGRVEAISAVLALTGDNAASATQQLENMRDAAGATDDAYAAMSQTLENQANRAMGAFRQIMNELGRDALPAFVGALELVNDLLRRFRSSNDIGEWAQTAILFVHDLSMTFRDFVGMVQNIGGSVLASTLQRVQLAFMKIREILTMANVHWSEVFQNFGNTAVSMFENLVWKALEAANRIAIAISKIPGVDIGPIGLDFEGFGRLDLGIETQERALERLREKMDALGRSIQSNELINEGFAAQSELMAETEGKREKMFERMAGWTREAEQRQQGNAEAAEATAQAQGNVTQQLQRQVQELQAQGILTQGGEELDLSKLMERFGPRVRDRGHDVFSGQRRFVDTQSGLLDFLGTVNLESLRRSGLLSDVELGRLRHGQQQMRRGQGVDAFALDTVRDLLQTLPGRQTNQGLGVDPITGRPLADTLRGGGQQAPQPQQIQGLFADVAKIREKVDKMAGLTGL